MKRITTGIVSGLLVLASFSSVYAEEDWKGKPESSEVGLGVLTGMGVIDHRVGFALLGTASKKIVHQGFVPDLNNSVSVEAQLGPVIMGGGTAIMFSGHLRWDFTKSSDWTFYALGGAGGNFTPVVLGDHFELFPRFGIGAFWDKLKGPFLFRAEVSHEFIGLGITFPFFY